MHHSLRTCIISASFTLLLAACGGGGDSGGGSGSTPAPAPGPTPAPAPATSNTVQVSFTKGPVSGAEASLIDADGNVVAGPVMSMDGVATFEEVTYQGMVYARFTGGSYTDEATGNPVNLSSGFTIRSGVIDNSGTDTVQLTATPLTEIGFLRAIAANTAPTMDLAMVNTYIDEVADEFGLDGIDLTTVTPTRLQDMSSSFTSDVFERDSYGTVLAAITQQILDAGDPADESSLQSYITDNVSGVDQTAFTDAVSNLQTNANTSSFVSTTVTNNIDTRSGIIRYSEATFKVDMGRTYNGTVSIEYRIAGFPNTLFDVLQSPYGDGVYEATIRFVENSDVTYRFIQGSSSGTVEVVPDDCSVDASGTRMRAVTVGTDDVTLLAVPFSDCIPDLCSADPGRSTPINVVGRQIRDGSTPIHMKGVAWSPYPVGIGPGFDGGRDIYDEAIDVDAPLMQAAGINVARTYGTIYNKSVLDKLWARGIYVLMTVYYGYSETIESTIQNVCAVKDHPAILGWVVGNEWNIFNVITFEGENTAGLNRPIAEIGLLADAIKLNDPTRPVSTVYGDMPSDETVERLANIDLWGLNVYRGLSFYGLFSEWENKSPTPMYLAEYGIDAYDGTRGREDEATQSQVLEALTLEIYANASVNGSGVAAGGVYFEFNDEWWKYQGAGNNPSAHDTAQSFSNGAFLDPRLLNPDAFVMEEWWGLVRLDRSVRDAYTTYQNLTPPSAP